VNKLSEENETIQCPCGREIEKPEDYKILFIKRELKEIDILCPNDACYLRELGYIQFEHKKKKAKFKEASFYPPFVTWNAGRIGSEEAEKLLKTQLKGVAKRVNWKRLSEDSTKSN
jgi:hypothetical protein